jgi:phosphoglycerate dehydrogenase-like enzyme
MGTSKGAQMKVVLPWPVADQQSEPMPSGVGLVEWLEGDPPDESLDAEFVVAPFSAGKPGRLSAFRRLEVVQTMSAGIDWIKPQLPPGVVLCDASGLHDIGTSEWVLTAILASVRMIPTFVRQQDQHLWRSEHTRELAGRRVLLVGYGSIGQAIEARLAGFQVEITRVARTAREGVHAFTELPQLVPYADIVILIVPLTDQTRGLVGKDFLAALPDGALVVNASRGPVLDADALVAELSAGRLTAALDVTVEEPLPADDPLWSAPGLLLTPHIGGDVTGLYPRLHRFVREQVERHLAGEPLQNVVTGDY